MAKNFFDNDFDLRPDYAKEEPIEEKSNEPIKDEIDLFNNPLPKEENEEHDEDDVEQPSIEEQIKKISALYGEQNIDIPISAKIKHKVDGQEVEVEVQELLNNYSGKTAWDKKFSELDKERSVYKQDLDVVNKYINEFAKISKEDPQAGMEFLAKFAGIDPLQYRRQMRDKFVEKYSHYLGMDEDQRRILELKEENEYFRGQKESEQKAIAERQAQAELQKQFKSVQEAHQIDDDRMQLLYGDLKAHIAAQGIKHTISPDDIVALHNAYVVQDRAVNALDSIDPKLRNDEAKINMVESLLKGNPQLSDDDLKLHIAKLWGNEVQKAEKDLQKKASIKKPQKSQEFKPKKLSGTSLDFFR